jgi:hypothetical protein
MADAATHQSIDVGTVLAGTYGIQRLLGKGGMGAVWEARHLRLEGKRVAIKVLHAEVASDAESLLRFRREAQIASRLGHPNIVQVIDFNELSDGTQYLVLEYLEGESLADRLSRGPLPVDQTMALVRQVGSALHATHRENIVHRDLKPHNIFLCMTETGGYVTELAKVLDFGISKMRDSQTVKTQTNTVLGTPQYMAPEQARGEHDLVDARTDIFALGAIVYEMLAGRPAFQGANIPEVMFKVVFEEPPNLAQLVPSLEPAIAGAVHRALAKKRDERFGDVSELIEALTGDPLITLRAGQAVAPMTGMTGRSGAAGSTALGTLDMTPRGLVALSGGARARSDDAFAATAGPGTQPGLEATMPPGNASAAMARTAAATGVGVSAAAVTAPSGDSVAHRPRGTPLGLVLGLVAVAVAAAVAITIVLVKAPPQEPMARDDAVLAANRAARDQAVVATGPGTGATAENPADPGKGHDKPHGQVGEQPDETDQPDEKPGEQPRLDGDRAAGSGQEGDTAASRDPSAAATTSGTSKKRARPQQADSEDVDPELARGPLAEQLKRAQALLKSGNYEGAIREARSSLGTRRTSVAYAIIVSAYCAQRDLGNARANMAHVKGRRARAPLVRFCQQYDIDLGAM